MSTESSLMAKGVVEDAATANDPGRLNQVEGVTEIESLCMNCHEDVRSTLPPQP
jgi:hypothetical protein